MAKVTTSIYRFSLHKTRSTVHCRCAEVVVLGPLKLCIGCVIGCSSATGSLYGPSGRCNPDPGSSSLEGLFVCPSAIRREAKVGKAAGSSRVLGLEMGVIVCGEITASGANYRGTEGAGHHGDGAQCWGCWPSWSFRRRYLAGPGHSRAGVVVVAYRHVFMTERGTS